LTLARSVYRNSSSASLQCKSRDDTIRIETILHGGRARNLVLIFGRRKNLSLFHCSVMRWTQTASSFLWRKNERT